MERNGLEETKAKEDFEDHKVGSTVTAGESLLPSVLQWRHGKEFRAVMHLTIKDQEIPHYREKPFFVPSSCAAVK